MARVIPFTQHEAVLLLDAYLSTLNKNITKTQAIQGVSKDLRKMAVNKGMKIDDAYRSVKGIPLRMASMESAYMGKTIYAPATKLFTETVKIFKENRSVYDQILKEARAMIDDKKEDVVFERLFEDEKYKPLYNALKKKGIDTIDALKEINLWVFMNIQQLYSIQQRLTIFTELTAVLKSKRKVDESQDALMCKVFYNGNTYKGESPSEAFMAFLIAIATKYPLRFRSLLGIANPESGKIVLNRCYDDTKLRMMNPEAYIDANLSLEQVDKYIAWVIERCGAIPREYSIGEPKYYSKTSDDDTGKQEHSNFKGTAETIVGYSSKQEMQQSRTSLNNIPDSASHSIQNAEEYLQQCDLNGATYDNLKEELHCTMVKTKEIVAKSPRIIEMSRRLYHENALVDFEEGADTIEAILDKLLKKGDGITTAKLLYEHACSEMAMFFNDNGITEQQAVFDLARHLFEKLKYHGKQYVFKSNIYISLPDICADSVFDIVKKYAREKGSTVIYDEIVSHLTGLGLNTGNLRGLLRIDKEPVFLIYAENEYLFAELVPIDDVFLKTIHLALQHLLEDTGGYIIPRNISDSWYKLLPTLPGALVWTPMLLQQLIRFYPDKLQARTIIAMDSQNSNTLHAMFVEKESWIQDFRDVVAVFLHNEMPNRYEFEAEELRGILVDAGMISGNQLIYNMPNALGGDPRFLWDSDGNRVKVRI